MHLSGRVVLASGVKALDQASICAVFESRC